MGTRLIKLTRSKLAIVDEEDFVELSKYSWYAFSSKGLWYAARKAKRRDTDWKYREVIFMHKQLLNTRSLVDHVDRNGLNNCRNNLRPASYRQNGANCSPRGTSQYKGLTFDVARQKWQVRCAGVFLGRFNTEEEAAKAYDQFAVEEYGEFAYQNFSTGGDNR